MTTAQPGQEQRMEPGADYFGNDEAQAWLNIGRVLVAQGILKYERAGDLHTVTITTRPTADLGEDGELVERLRAYRGGTTEWRDLMDEAADRLILYREALAAARPYVEANASRDSRMTAHHKGADVLDMIDAVLSRSGL